jgi:repressor LexA
MPYAKRLAPTRRQAELLAFIRQYIAEHGQAPHRAEMAAALGLRSLNSVRDLLIGLQQRGQIQVTFGLVRNVALVDDVVAPVVALQPGCKS